MKLTEKTLNLLTNFSGINESIYIESGSVLRTLSNNKKVSAKSEIDEDIPMDFAIYDLHMFLSTINMFPGADIDFHDKYCTIEYEASSMKTNYTYAHKDSIIYSNKDVNMPQTEVNFKITEDEFARLNKARKALNMPDIFIEPENDSQVRISVTDTDNPTSHEFSIVVDSDHNEETFGIVIDVDDFLSMLERNYDVGISFRGIGHFSSDDVQYWVALSAKSTFE